MSLDIAALITNIEENGGNNHGADDYSYLMEALAALKSLAQQVQLQALSKPTADELAQYRRYFTREDRGGMTEAETIDFEGEAQLAPQDFALHLVDRIEALLKENQLLKGADEERARLRKALEYYRKVEAGGNWRPRYDGGIATDVFYMDEWTPWDTAEKALAASPTGYTERLEQFLENEVRHQACKTTDRCLFQGRVADLCDTAKQLLSDHAIGNR